MIHDDDDDDSCHDHDHGGGGGGGGYDDVPGSSFFCLSRPLHLPSHLPDFSCPGHPSGGLPCCWWATMGRAPKSKQHNHLSIGDNSLQAPPTPTGTLLIFRNKRDFGCKDKPWQNYGRALIPPIAHPTGSMKTEICIPQSLLGWLYDVLYQASAAIRPILWFLQPISWSPNPFSLLPGLQLMVPTAEWLWNSQRFCPIFTHFSPIFLGSGWNSQQVDPRSVRRERPMSWQMSHWPRRKPPCRTMGHGPGRSVLGIEGFG